MINRLFYHLSNALSGGRLNTLEKRTVKLERQNKEMLNIIRNTKREMATSLRAHEQATQKLDVILSFSGADFDQMQIKALQNFEKNNSQN